MATDFIKDPDAVLDYSWDWSSWLEPGETITTSDVFVTPGITLGTTSHTNVRATAWLSGGTNASLYQVTNRISTSLGRTDDRTITIRVTNR
jgi:hypothetical protein